MTKHKLAKFYFSAAIFFYFCAILCSNVTAHGAFTNYHSVMLGDRAGGMGGAYTALTDDTAAAAFYNPATLARLDGLSLSTSVSLFNKYDVTYDNQQDLDDSIFRINKGSIISIPSASGIYSSFKNFTAGLSIVIPDYQSFGGDVFSNSTDTTFLRLDDKSLWVGGAFAFNPSEWQSLGLTVYYTSQSFSRSLRNRYDSGADTIVFNEEKTYSTNSFVFLIGHYIELNRRFRLGASYRFKSIPVSGEGSFSQSQIGTVSGAQPIISNNKLEVETKIPDRFNLGIAFVHPRELTLSLDLSYYGSNSYTDSKLYGDKVKQNDVLNVAIGYEKYLEPWLALRMGLFTDYSSAPKIPTNLSRRYSDRIDKYGFSANFGIHTTKHTIISLGGYFLDGEGYSSEYIGSSFRKVKKSERLFSFLVGSSYSF